MSQVPQKVHDALAEQGLSISKGNIVVFREDAPAHPRNWSSGRKVYETGVLTAFITIS